MYCHLGEEKNNNNSAEEEKVLRCCIQTFMSENVQPPAAFRAKNRGTQRLFSLKYLFEEANIA